MNLIREIWEQYPFYGYRRIHAVLRRDGHLVNRKRVQRCMQKAGLQALYPKPRTSKGNKEHRKYPCLVRNLETTRPGQVWSTDITYLKIGSGHMYLIAILDVYSRYVLSWRLSNTLDTKFCLEALMEALQRHGPPEIMNTDQGCQFTSDEWVYTLKNWGVKPSMTGVGRSLDNVHIERFWRALKYEDAHLQDYQTAPEARSKLKHFIQFYNQRRPHQSLNYRTPEEAFLEKHEQNPQPAIIASPWQTVWTELRVAA